MLQWTSNTGLGRGANERRGSSLSRTNQERGGRRRGDGALFCESVGGSFRRLSKIEGEITGSHRSLIQGLRFNVSI
jgi:hypothetical protein